MNEGDDYGMGYYEEMYGLNDAGPDDADNWDYNREWVVEPDLEHQQEIAAVEFVDQMLRREIEP